MIRIKDFFNYSATKWLGIILVLTTGMGILVYLFLKTVLADQTAVLLGSTILICIFFFLVLLIAMLDKYMRFIYSEQKKLKKLTTVFNVDRDATLPFGNRLKQDMIKYFPLNKIKIIFDVGANVGQSAKEYLEQFPDSQIYSFEPVPDTYNVLKSNFENNDRVSCYKLAFGEKNGKGSMMMKERSRMHYLVDESKKKNENNETDCINIMKIDAFSKKNKIERIDFLKIDTEGGDLDVLKGAENMLKSQKIDFVQVEAGMNPDNNHHVPFECLKSFLEKYNYYLFGIYDQVNEWPSEEPHLRRTNSVFVSRKIIKEKR